MAKTRTARYLAQTNNLRINPQTCSSAFGELGHSLPVSLLSERPLNIAVAVQHMKNQHVRVFTIDDDVLPDGKTPQAGAQIVPEAAHVGVVGKKEETVGDGIIELSIAIHLGPIRPNTQSPEACGRVRTIYAAQI